MVVESMFYSSLVAHGFASFEFWNMSVVLGIIKAVQTKILVDFVQLRATKTQKIPPLRIQTS